MHAIILHLITLASLIPLAYRVRADNLGNNWLPFSLTGGQRGRLTMNPAPRINGVYGVTGASRESEVGHWIQAKRRSIDQHVLQWSNDP